MREITMGLLKFLFLGRETSKEKLISVAEGNGQKSPSSKAAAFLTRGAYLRYVSTAKGRERRLACPILLGGPFVFNIPTMRCDLREGAEVT
jgi:hypothetical protein